MTKGSSFVGVQVQGGLVPAELLSKLSSGKDLDGLSSTDYHLAAGENVREAANRVWAYLRGAWTTYSEALDKLPDDDRATTLTRDRWSMILLGQLGYGKVPLSPAGGLTADGRQFPISHIWENVPAHLLGARIDLDRRTVGVAGAASQSPQSMVQEYLNLSENHLWALLSNGRVLRLLRDSTSLVGSAYVEFDLEAIFDGDLFSDFLLLYSMCHQSRTEILDTEIGPESCWLEKWRNSTLESGTRALNLLRNGVVEALETLGTGFLSHPANDALRQDARERATTIEDLNHALLRAVYRMLFTFVAEDRGALVAPDATAQARDRFDRYFSTQRLRSIARRKSGGRHGDLWQALGLVWRALGRESGQPELGLAGIGGLFDNGELDFLVDCQLSNEALLSAVRSLSIVSEPKTGFKRVIDHRNLGAEELGSIYESLLEFVPHWDETSKRFSFGSAAGNSRKTTGSYYTPTSLIDSLLDTALDPVLDVAVKGEDPERALLSLKVCDPACGSGHFLVGAARRIAKRVAAIRSGDPEPAPQIVREAMRDVIANCIYGVDLNPLAAELAKVSLWLEAVEPGRPLAFLDAHIKVGNALIGVTPRLLQGGIPDEAFKPIEGDDKKFASSLAKQNKTERSGQGSLFDVDTVRTDNRSLAEKAQEVLAVQGLSLGDVHIQQQRLRAYVESADYTRQRLVADAWCASFVWRKTPSAPKAVTHDVLTALDAEPERVLVETRREVERLAAEYRFFHWHLEFPEVFPTVDGNLDEITGWAGGFDAVLGNPPWERVKLQEQEFFASRDADVAGAANASLRKKAIAVLVESNPALHREFIAARRRAEGESQLLRLSGRYPLTGRGDINTYAVFAEANRTLLGPHGRLGIIVPTGIATDATTQFFFKDLVTRGPLSSLYDFENAKPLFDGVHRSFKFSLLTIAGRKEHEPAAEFAFFMHDPSDLNRANARFELTPAEINLLNPNTGTCPVFRSRRDAEITLGIYRRVPVLINENDPVNGNPWGIKFMTMFHMSNDSHLFHTREELEADGWTLNGNVFEKSNGGGG